MENYFRNLQWLLIVSALICVTDTQSNELKCDAVKSHNYYNVGVLKTCFVQTKTAILVDTVTFAQKDETIKALDLLNNLQISFLPIKVFENFPQLVTYKAEQCSIKSLSNTNFVKLHELKQLRLGGNKIESIGDNTFEGLIALEYLDLSKCYRCIKMIS